MSTSALNHLECAKCAKRHDADSEQHLCTCGGPLLARYDLEKARASLTPQALADRPHDLWRFRALLPVRDPRHATSLGERATPNIRLAKFGAAIGIDALIVKDEALLPTGSFKARGAGVGVARAKELGAHDVALPTNGNAGAAWAAYGARAGLNVHVAMPRSAPSIHARECEALGADLELVDGSIADAGKLAASWIARHGYYDATTLKEPYRIEGKKTMGFEIAESFGWRVPDVVIYPTGGGVGLIGIHKAIEELRAAGFVRDKQPRYVAVQSSGCAPIVRAWDQKKPESAFWDHADTFAYGISVPKALGDFLVLRILYETDGAAIAVPDDEIAELRTRVAREEGLLLCPEGAATIAAAQTLRANGWLDPGDRVLAINTGSGLKY